MSNLDIGMIVEVNGVTCKIATFDKSNHQTFINNGQIIKNVSVNSFILVTQGFNKIVCRINSETIWDPQNNSKNYSLDTRFSKNSIKRTLDVQTIGYISQGTFFSGSTYLPMIGNICSIPTDNEVMQIYLNSFENSEDDMTISIGNSLNERNEITLPINSFFASHIGIFGNTGSGKSNTLHKLFYELFRLPLENLKNKSRFVILDFNGEYVHKKSFGVTKSSMKKVFELSTRDNDFHRYPILFSTFYDEEILSILFQASAQTQKPFLIRIIKGQNKYGLGMNSISRWISFLIRNILTSEPNLDLKNRIITILERIIADDQLHYLNKLRSVQIHFKDGKKFICQKDNGHTEFFDGEWKVEYDSLINLSQIESLISSADTNSFKEFELRCKLQLINDLLYGNVISDHIDPLIKRVESKTYNMTKYLVLIEELKKPCFLEIISLKNLNQEAKQIMAMLISKMYFDYHKRDTEIASFHLIIDEAHNLLSAQSARENDSWRDYRLSTFEEIIKEGRKFGFFLTLSSQRPADISPTLLSQVHNFFLHKLVNERDLQIVDNSLSTLDRTSKSMLPSLAQGVCIISGTALSLPLIVTIDFINDDSTRPQSDTINLIKTWK